MVAPPAGASHNKIMPDQQNHALIPVPVATQYFVQKPLEDSAEWSRVHAVAEALRRHLDEPAAQQRLALANLPGQSSAMVQATFAPFAAEAGFTSEAKGLFKNYETPGVRPDYFLPMQDIGTGILLEVERGKTTINNMDFLDFWKCHLCEHANYLFLVVPQKLVQSDQRAPTKPYAAVVKRMGSFFVPRNYTNVRGLCIFGY